MADANVTVEPGKGPFPAGKKVQLKASVIKGSASAWRWQKSESGTDWTDIPGEDLSSYEVDVDRMKGQSVHVVATVGGIENTSDKITTPAGESAPAQPATEAPAVWHANFALAVAGVAAIAALIIARGWLPPTSA